MVTAYPSRASAEAETETWYASGRPPPPVDADASSVTPSHGPSAVAALSAARGITGLEGAVTTTDPLTLKEFLALFRMASGAKTSASPGAAEARDPKYTASVRSSLQAHAEGDTRSALSAEPPSAATVALSKYVAHDVSRESRDPSPSATRAARARFVSTSNTTSTRVRSSATAADAATGAGRRTISRRNGAPCASVPKTRGASQYVPTSDRLYVARAVAVAGEATESSVTSSTEANRSPAPWSRPPEDASGAVAGFSPTDSKISNVSAAASAAPSATSLP